MRPVALNRAVSRPRCCAGVGWAMEFACHAVDRLGQSLVSKKVWLCVVNAQREVFISTLWLPGEAAMDTVNSKKCSCLLSLSLSFALVWLTGCRDSVTTSLEETSP